METQPRTPRVPYNNFVNFDLTCTCTLGERLYFCKCGTPFEHPSPGTNNISTETGRLVEKIPKLIVDLLQKAPY